VDRIDEAHLALFEGHDQGMSADAVAEKAHATEDAAVSDARAGEDDLPAGGEIFSFVDTLGIADAHFGQALLMLGLADHQARKHFPIQAAQRGGSEHAFGRAAGAHDGVDASANDGSRDTGGKIAIADQANARARGADLLD